MMAPRFSLYDVSRYTFVVRACVLIFILVFSGGWSRLSEAQSIQAYVSADSVRVGDRFTLTLVAEHPLTQEPLFPGPQDGEEVFGDLTVLEVMGSGSIEQMQNNVAVRVDSLMYEVTTFALDTAYVPSIPVFFASGGDTTFYASRPIELPIISMVTEDASDIRDIAPILDFPRNIWPWIIGLLLVAAVIAGLVFYLSRRAPMEEQVVVRAPVPQLPPYEEALKKLRGLEKQSNLDDVYRIKPYYVELTGILRYYLGRRLHINAMESTSRELMDDINQLAHKTDLPNEAAYLLRRILHVADLVKFADMRPGAEVGHQAMVETRKVLDVVENSFKQVSEPVNGAETVYEKEGEPAHNES